MIRPLLLLSLLLVSACTIPTKPVIYGPAMNPQQAQMLYKNTDVKPTYQWVKHNVFRLCMYCHTAKTVNFLTYNNTLKVIVPNNPEASLLYQQVASGRMPRGGAKLSKEKRQAIYDWIEQGAKND